MNFDLRSKSYLAILLFSFFLQSSCTERMDIELDSTFTRCVIFGSITTDTTSHKITITRTGDFFSNTAPQGISGANVRIWDGVNSFVLSEDPEVPGNYFTEPTVFARLGRTYTLFVDNVDLLVDGNLTNYQAITEIRPVAKPDSIRVIFRTEWQGWIVQAFAKDPPETEDYYKFLVYRNGELHSDSLMNINISDDLLFNGSYTNGIPIYFLRAENGFTIGDEIMVEFCGITRDYFKYLNEVQTSSRPSVPLFSGPPANPRSNLSNGAIGFFTAYSISKAKTIIKE
jgi:hypothetical protein